MCGIVGFIGENNNKNIITDMLATIKHRGLIPMAFGMTILAIYFSAILVYQL